jgi:Fe-Mn family superoxide dismutase
MNVIVPPLPFAMDALEPHLSRRTLAAHYGRHHVGYVDKTRRFIESTPLESASLEAIVQTSHELGKPALFNAAAQAWNHSFYWSSLHPVGGGDARGAIAERIDASFGSQVAFRELFVATACEVVGSGWVWLVFDGERLKIVATENADTALVAAHKPLLVLDVWEHAYYLDYQHRRPDYVAAFMSHLANWEFANRNLAAALDLTRSNSRWKTAARAAAAEVPLRSAGGLS